MPDVMTMFDPSIYLTAIDLAERDVTIEIESVTAGELVGELGRKARKPMVKVKGKDKILALNKTNAKTVIRLYGRKTEAWIGKLITLFPTTTTMEGGERKECIRIRPTVPPAKAPAKAPTPAPPSPPAPPSDEERRAIAAERDAEYREIEMAEREAES